MDREERVNIMLNNLVRIAGGDFSLEYTASDDEDDFSALELGIILLADQLKDTTASKEEYEKVLIQKNILFQEVHHRVKNNLQFIISLLRLQADAISDKEAKELFEYSQHRIRSMAMVHEMLYQSNDISKINYNDYLYQLIKNLVNSVSDDRERFKLELNAENIFLSLDTSIPLGLIINEIVTNSLIHGVVEGRTMLITVNLTKEESNNYILQISDNGAGFNGEVINLKSSSMGLNLIQILTEQINGDLVKLMDQEGTGYKLVFQDT